MDLVLDPLDEKSVVPVIRKELDDLEAQFTEFFKQKINQLTRHFVHWNRLVANIKSKLKGYSEQLEEFYNEPQIPEFRTYVALATREWANLKKVGSLHKKGGLYSKENKLLCLEFAIYESFEQLVSLMEGKSSGVSAEAKSMDEDTGSLLKKRRAIFWHRFFGFATNAIKAHRFCWALRLHLFQEFGQVGIDEKVFPNVIKAVLDEDASEDVTVQEWVDFIYRFGPLEQCFEKAQGVTVPVPHEPEDTARPSDYLAPWFMFVDRNKAAIHLTTPKTSSGKRPRFIFRHGRTNDKHAFSFSYMNGNTAAASKVTIVTKDPALGTCEYAFENRPQSYKDMRSFVLSLNLPDAAGCDGWKDIIDHLKAEQKSWEDHKSVVYKQEGKDSTSMVRALKAYFEAFGLDDSVIPVEYTDSDRAKLPELQEIMADEDEKQALEKLKVFCAAANEQNGEQAAHKYALENYVPENPAENIAHEIVRRSMKNLAWADVLEDVARAGVNVHLHVGEDSVFPILLVLGDGPKSQNTNQIVTKLLACPANEQIQIDAVYNLLETAVLRYDDEMVDFVLQLEIPENECFKASFQQHIRELKDIRSILHVMANIDEETALVDEAAANKANGDEEPSAVPPPMKSHPELSAEDKEKRMEKIIDQIILFLFPDAQKDGPGSFQRNESTFIERRASKSKHKQIPHIASHDHLVHIGEQQVRHISVYDFLEGLHEGRTAALIAAEKNNKCALKRLSSWRARLDPVDPEDGQTVLHHILRRKDCYDFREIETLFDKNSGGLGAVLNVRDRNHNLTPLGMVLEDLTSTKPEAKSQRSLCEKLVIFLLSKGAKIETLSTKERNVLADVLCRKMEESDIHRWLIIKNAVLHGDEHLVSLIMTPPFKEIPYVLNPYELAFPTVYDDLEGCRRDPNEDVLSAIETKLQALPAPFQKHDRNLERRGFTSPEKLNQSLLHIAVSSSHKNIAIVNLILEYKPPEDAVIATIRAANRRRKPVATSSTHGDNAPPHLLRVVSAGIEKIAPRPSLPLSRSRTSKADDVLHKSSVQLRSAPLTASVLRLSPSALTGSADALSDIELPPRRFRRIALRNDIHFCDLLQRNALHIVAYCDQVTSLTSQIFHLLLKKNLSISKQDLHGYTPLHYAARSNQVEIVEYLIASHANLEAKSGGTKDDDVDAKVQLFLETDDAKLREKSANTIKFLQDKLKEENEEKQRPLHLAAERGNWQVVSSLTKNGAQVQVFDGKGRTPLALAMLARMDLVEREKKVYLEMKTAYDSGHMQSSASPALQSTKAVAVALPQLEERKVPNVPEIEMAEIKEEANHFVSSSVLSISRASSEVDVVKPPISRPSSGSRQLSRPPSATYSNEAPPPPLPAFDPPSVAPRPTSPPAEERKETKQKKGVKEVILNLGKFKKKSVKLPAETKSIEPLPDKPKTSPDEYLQNYLKFKEDKENYENVIDSLLNSGASIQSVTEASGHHLEELFDVQKEWAEIHDNVHAIDQKLRDGSNSKNKGEGTQVLLQRKQEIFADRTNQMLINHVYSDMEVRAVNEGEVKKDKVVLDEQEYTVSVRVRHYLRLSRYIIFLVSLTVLGIYQSTRNTRQAHYYWDSMRQAVAQEYLDADIAPLPKTFEGLNSKDDYWNWGKSTMINSFYADLPTYWKSSYPVQESRGVGFINDQIRIVGRPRFRQIRSKVTECDVPSSFKDYLTNICFDGEDTEPFGPNLEYTWQSQSELDGVYHYGKIDSYPGSGYVYLLPTVNNYSDIASGGKNLNFDRAKREIQMLQDIGWIDARTRVIHFEAVLMNANYNYFMFVRMTGEQPGVGGMVPSWTFDVTRMKKYVSRDDYGILALEVWVVILVLLHLLAELRQCIAWKFSYFTSLYNFIDLCMSCLCVIIIVLHFVTLGWEMQVDWFDAIKFTPVAHINYWTSIQNDVFSFVVLLAWFKLLEYLSVFQRFSRLVVIVEMVIRRLVPFFLLFIVVVVSFSSASYIAYGYRQDSAFTWLFSFLTRLANSFNPDTFDPNTQPNVFLGTIYDLSFVILVSLILLNLIIAVMNSAYEEALTESGDSYWAQKQYEWITTSEKSSGMTARMDRLLLRAYDFLGKAWRWLHDKLISKHFQSPPIPKVELVFRKEKNPKRKSINYSPSGSFNKYM